MTLLSPAQQRAFDGLQAAWPFHHTLVLTGGVGEGKSTVLRALHATRGGGLVSMRDYFGRAGDRHPLALEESLERLLASALDDHEHLFVDDLHLIGNVVGGCGEYPRSGFIAAALTAVADRAEARGRKLIVAYDGWPPHPLGSRGRLVNIDSFAVEDFAFFGGCFLASRGAGALDFAKVHRYAPGLNGHQWRQVSTAASVDQLADTDRFIEYLRDNFLVSNVDLQEVQAVTLRDLRGVDDVVQALETHIVLPLEDTPLAEKLQLRPKRGVLLVGPPGTGKTTVGRALARRLKGKFFLIDGTCISGTQQFYWHVNSIYESAKKNAPSVIFIDDSDVIFESGELGLYRYLLTMLDGLESASSGRVCVMLTAMDVSHLPPALLRSGRVELWLEMRLPNGAAREEILRSHLEAFPSEYGAVDVAGISETTDGCTGADLKRLCEDGKNLLAADLSAGRAPRPATEYFLDAVHSLRLNKQRYEQAERSARQKRPDRPVYFDLSAADAT